MKGKGCLIYMRHNKKLENEIKNGENLEVNLPQYMNEMASAYYSYASSNFVIHYYDFYEGLLDDYISLDEQAYQLLNGINEVVEESLLKEFNGQTREASIVKLDAIRNDITRYMKVLTAYTDVFTLYEYVMNRMELKFEDTMEDVENDLVVNDILNFIFSERENVTINERIKLMISQMPVRMTKTKFFDLLNNALSIYEGGDKTSLENFVYMIRSAAGVDAPEGMDQYFIALKECKDAFIAADFNEMDETMYQQLDVKLKDAVAMLLTYTEGYYAMQQVLNYLYTLVLNQPYASATATESLTQLLGIVKAVNQGFMSEKKESVPEELLSLFTKTEGKLEKDMMDVQILEGTLDIIANQHVSMLEALMLDKTFGCLIYSSKLISSSVFVELNPQNQEGNKTTNKEDIKEAFEALYKELGDSLQSQPKLLNRAMIASVLKELPVFFVDKKEVADYIKNSLASCRDLSEKLVSIRLMNELISEARS